MKFAISMLIVVSVYLTTVAAAPQLRQRSEKQVQREDDLPTKGATIEEVIVETPLYIKPKARQQVRRVRAAPDNVLAEIYATHKRVKRQRFGGFGSGGGGFGNTQVGSSAGVGGTQAGVNVGAGQKGGNAGAQVQLGPQRPLGPNGYSQEQAAANGGASSHHNNRLGSGSSAANAQAQGFQSQGANNSFGASSTSTATQAQNINPFGFGSNSAGASQSLLFNLPNGQTVNFASTNNFANNGLGNNANSRGSSVSVSG
ncbi:glycine-rich RNA-binding protein 3, mitochondrial [Scaptodrosophila lebanonensis]|uniref:Glycine-rich RNA-binding protein 3, mitochondrial n=1 Tax=Drosophila lebanonensis TaxID=7225 RepID=A0A6J2UMC3_DROLE|nr:glycine-rich RNA-binding protein 3, mitochondrial [Scaptodrosophila lebanonensis]